jgi:hypothetical protein
VEILKHTSFEQAVEGSGYKMFLLDFGSDFDLGLKEQMLEALN